MIGIGILGTVVVLAATVFWLTPRYLQSARTNEHRNTLGQIGKDAALAYERDGRLCPSSRGPVPRSLASVRGKKYLSTPPDWSDDPGFACLGFAMEMPQYYQYEYRVDARGTAFVVTAHGDLDGDEKPSTFRLRGKVAGGKVVIDPAIEDDDPEE